MDTARFAPALGALLDSVIEQVAEAHHEQVTEAHLLSMALQVQPAAERLALPTGQRDQRPNALALLDRNLAVGVQLDDCVQALAEVFSSGTSEINPFERDNWREPLPELIEGLPDGAGIPDLLKSLFLAADRLVDGTLLSSLFQVERILGSLEAAASGRSVFPVGVEGEESPPLDPAAFTPRARFLFDKALRLAATTGAASCDAGTLLIAMVQAKDTYTQVIMARAGVSVGSAKVASYLATATTEVHPEAGALPATGDNVTPELHLILESALQRALTTGGDAIGERELLARLLEGQEPKLRYLLDDVLDVPVDLVHELLDTVAEPGIIEPQLPRDLCPMRNVTLELERGKVVAPVGRDQLTEQIVRVLFRRNNRNVLLHGEHGVGASTMADVLADALRRGRWPALGNTQVISFDLSSLDGEKYEHATEKLLDFMDSEPERIYVLDGFGQYFAEHFARSARRLRRNAYRLIMLVEVAEYTRLQSGSEPLSGFLDEIEVTEPTPELTTAIVGQAIDRIAAASSVRFDDNLDQIVMRMAGNHILSARLPGKAVELLERAAADVAADAEMNNAGVGLVDRRAVARQVARITGVPVETVLGTGQDRDYFGQLSSVVVGQDVAVAKVAGRLDLIQKGLVNKKAPAAVFIFAGLSGTGKTELAKQIAQIYSQTHAMISFPMENFGEAHSVSKLIGSPPGYIGYEEGGPLVNALNRDPYAVVLLDEIEKAHPAVWDPFLNLFDEGSITDSRGVTASGSRAFFVLTSNIGQYEIADMLARGASPAEIEDTVTKLFPQHQHEQAHVATFRPEFIGRVMNKGGIVAFNALSYESLLGIARHGADKIACGFSENYEGRLICDLDVLEMIAHRIHDENSDVIRDRRPGYLGARRIQQLLDQFVNQKLADKIRQVATAPVVRVVLHDRGTDLIPVYDDAEAEALLSENRARLVGRVEQRFSRLLSVPEEVFASLPEERLNRLDRLLSEVGAIV